jgi:hypothetical protein
MHVKGHKTICVQNPNMKHIIFYMPWTFEKYLIFIPNKSLEVNIFIWYDAKNSIYIFQYIVYLKLNR